MSKKMAKAFSGQSAFITGGSKGIGKAVAKEIAANGGNVCIVARDMDALNKAADEISAARLNDRQSVEILSADCTDFDKMKSVVSAYITAHGVPQFLLNFVGYAYPNYIQEFTIDDFKKNMHTNYYGQLVPILAFLPHLLKAQKGHIVNCSSVSGYLGLMGYATYTPTKFAIVGLTETLRNELKNQGITFSLLYPPDTDTPGFEKENKTKPKELSILSEGGGLLKPEVIARKLLKGVANNKFYILPGQSRLLWTLVRHFPNLSHRILDNELKKARKKISPAS